MADIIQIICDGTLHAAAKLLPEFPKAFALAKAEPDKQASLVCDQLREVLKAEVPTVLEGLKDAVDTTVGQKWVETLLQAECIRMATVALRQVEESLGGEEDD